MILNSINSVVSLLLVMAVGYWLAGMSFFEENHGEVVFTKYLTKIGIPAYMFYSISTSFDTREEMLEIMKQLPLPFATILFQFALGYLIVKLFQIRENRRGVFINCCALSNVVFLGLPVVTSIFGDSVTPAAMIYYTANTVIFWTLGTFLLRQDGGERNRMFSAGNLRKIMSPPMIGLLCGFAAVLSGVKLPVFFMSACKSIHGTCSPMGLMFIGTVIRKAEFGKSGFWRDTGILTVVRYGFMPLILGAFFMAVPVSGEVKQVYYILSLMPAMTQLGIMAKAGGSDSVFASIWIGLSSVIGVATIPVYIWMLQNWFAGW